MSAVAKPQTVAQLCECLWPHDVVIHHDQRQQLDFRIDLPHVSFVPDPRPTGYGTWLFPAGILHLLRHCLEHREFDYFQLLSPACLPIRPLAEFKKHVAAASHDAHLDFLDLDEQDVMVHFSPRSFAPPRSLRRLLLRKAKYWYLGSDYDVRERGMLQVFSPIRGKEEHLPLRSRIGLQIIRLGKRQPFSVRPPAGASKLFIGGPWIGATRSVCEHVIARAENPDWLRYFRRVNDICELTFATILGNSGYRIGPANHYISEYTDWHPRWLEEKDIGTLSETGRYFARKFPDDPAAEVRARVVRDLVKPTHRTIPKTIVDLGKGLLAGTSGSLEMGGLHPPPQ